MMEDSQLINEVLELSLVCQQGEATPEQHARLERLFVDNPRALYWYVRIVDDTLTLVDTAVARETASSPTCPPRGLAFIEGLAPSARRGFLAFTTRRTKWSLAVAALASTVLLATIGAVSWRSSQQAQQTVQNVAERGSARIVEIDNVKWAENQPTYQEWAIVRSGSTLKFSSGWMNLFISDGAELLIEGPADVQYISPQKVFARQGKLAARIGPGAIGFRIETPHANVIDRGTEFGISVDGDSHTSVVVYKGIVDLDVLGDAAQSEQPRHRLETGEAMSVDRDGQLSRISTVESSEFLEPPQIRHAASQPSRLIASVNDNARSLATAKYYRVIPHGFREDCQAYVDRMHEWNGIDKRGLPPFLVGGDYVMTYNDDKITSEIEVALEVRQPANLYVLLDDRVPTPAWLELDFVNTNWKVGGDDGWEEGDIHVGVGPGESVEQTFSVWRRVVKEPTTVVLGSLTSESPPPSIKVGRSMYGIVATPLRGS
jgi:hypothetical protein